MRYWSKITIFILPAFDAPIRGPHWNIAISFDVEKLEWCGYPTVEFYLYPTVGTVLIHSIKPELTE